MRIIPYLRIALSVFLVYWVITYTIPTIKSWVRIETLSMVAFVLIAFLMGLYLLYLLLETLDELKGEGDSRSKGFRVFGLLFELLFLVALVIANATNPETRLGLGLILFLLTLLVLSLVDFGKLRMKYRNNSFGKVN